MAPTNSCHYHQKSTALKELRRIRKKILEGFDLRQIAKGAQLAKSEVAIKVYKELGDINGKDYYNAEKAKTIEHKINHLVRLGVRVKNYKFANAKIMIYANVGYSDKSIGKLTTTQRKINNLIKVGARENVFNQEKAKFSTLTITVNKTQNKVFDSVLVKVAQTIGSKDYELKQNPKGVSSIVIKDRILTPELERKIKFIAKTILRREEKMQNKFNDYKKQSILIKKKPTKREFLHRKRALERFAIRQSTQIKEAIKVFRRNKDLDTVKLLRGMLKESNYKKIIGGHQAVQNSIIKSRARVRVGR